MIRLFICMNCCLRPVTTCISNKIIRWMILLRLMGGDKLLNCARLFILSASFLTSSSTQYLFDTTWWSAIHSNFKWRRWWGVLTIKLIPSRRMWRQGWHHLNNPLVVSPHFLWIQRNWRGGACFVTWCRSNSMNPLSSHMSQVHSWIWVSPKSKSNLFYRKEGLKEVQHHDICTWIWVQDIASDE